MTDTTCPMVLHPEWAYQDQETLIRSTHRTQAGNHFAYLWGKFSRFRIPLRFVDSYDQSRLGDWWRNQHEIAITLDGSQTESTILCRMVNQSVPLDAHIIPCREYFQGVLDLESLEDSTKMGRPFILDDPYSGLLDQTYNALLG